ncbi:hypothetical protein Ae168Ps1_2716c [Pseudonocardia sp. Ae168_Ps1]|uniref:helix-turn-helix domain-containing protein n=1 Tax=unclassified Pseudonocardia TaxID=2619320 RepID=UPI00094ADB68|nr:MULTISPECIES: helix-turn-helix transcriptional regulator [unclassified Pseudonocardia]OLL74328.1 hypothetical protein Ae150APs1_2706c [Pseudonocardia sp. Ae150A_Ps1]OLL80310.1 hypothetical protein Ae168Ps1_2716c [Pseudonocardia sp. Ae168_Ps1]OLL85563.1 hypothetical protein Ae263Ps1_2618 [Pseudonocardia sp. Ae263_Ps1]OLL94408.1 hypothetical protein Ae356Ps1_4305c [Pseudonocardia sp. Ae356_Ps1]
MSDEPDGVRNRLTVRDKINQAFETLHPADRGPYTPGEVDRWLTENSKSGEPTISENYIRSLKSGERQNPTVNHLQALARFFDIPVAYFVDQGTTADAIHSDLQMVAAMRDSEVRNIAARAMDLDPDMRKWLNSVVTSLPASQPRSSSRRRRFQAPTDHDPGEHTSESDRAESSPEPPPEP